jgi:hypothetical protein
MKINNIFSKPIYATSQYTPGRLLLVNLFALNLNNFERENCNMELYTNNIKLIMYISNLQYFKHNINHITN